MSGGANACAANCAPRPVIAAQMSEAVAGAAVGGAAAEDPSAIESSTALLPSKRHAARNVL